MKIGDKVIFTKSGGYCWVGIRGPNEGSHMDVYGIIDEIVEDQKGKPSAVGVNLYLKLNDKHVSLNSKRMNTWFFMIEDVAPYRILTEKKKMKGNV